MAEDPYARFVSGQPAADDPYAKFAPGYVAPKADGQMVSGFKRSFEEVPGLAAGVAAYGADVVGATETRDALLQYAQRKNDEVAAGHANDAQSITDAWDGKTGWLDFLANASGYVAGQALQSIATGGLGAVGARMLAKQGAKELAEGVAAREIAAGATAQAAEAAVANALARSATKTATRGAVAGAGAHNFAMELGSIYPDAVEEAGGADNLDGGDKFRVFAAASLAAGVDTAGEAIMASRFLKGSKAGAPKVGPDGVISEGPGLLGRAAREIPAGMARESITEGIQTGLEQYGAAKTIGDAASIKDIVDSMGVGAVGGALGGAAGARKARPIEQPAPEPVTAILAAPDIDTAIAATWAAIEEPTARERNAATVDEIRQLAPELQSEAIGLLSTANGANTPGHVKRYAQNRLDEMLLPLRQIPVGEVIEDPAGTIPVPETQELTSTEATSQILLPPEPGQMRPVGSRIPVGRTREITPESIELGSEIPVGDVIEAGGGMARPDGMPERRNTDGQALDFGAAPNFNAPHSVFNYVQTIAGLGTPASRAFVQDYRAGRISNEDVLNLLVPTRKQPTPDERIAAAAAQAPKAQDLQPGDLLTSDGKPYGVRVAAAVRAKKEGGTVVEVQGGWAVRPKEIAGAQPNVPVPAPVAVRAPDGAGDQPGGSGATVRPVADAGPAGQVYPGVPEAAASGIADQPAAGSGLEPDQTLTSNGFIAAPNGYKVRVARHQRGSNALDPTADVGAFTYEVRKGDNDPNPLTIVVSKDGKLVPAKSVLTDNKSNGTAWVPRSEESASTVSGLLAERAGTAVGSPERKVVDAKIAEAVAADQAGPTGGSAATNQALSDDLPTLKAAWSDAAARGDDAAMKRINDRIVAIKARPVQETPKQDQAGPPAAGPGESQAAPASAPTQELAQSPSGSSPAVARLNKVMRSGGWEVDYADLDLTGAAPKAKFRLKRGDGRFLIANVDSLGRSTIETFQRDRELGIDRKNPQARLAPQINDVFLGRQKFADAKAMLQGMVAYVADNSTSPVALEDLRAAWGDALGVNGAPALPAPTVAQKLKAKRAKKQDGPPKKTFAELAQEAQDSVPGYLGKNADGEIVYEDKRGVRSILRDGVRITEPVARRPTRDGVKLAVEHRGEYLTVEESSPAPVAESATTAPAPATVKESLSVATDPTLDDELNDALGKLGDVLGDVFGAKKNITGPQYSAGDLLPALSKVVELLVRKGFKSFGQAAGKAAQLMRENPKTAPHVDAISPRQWKAAYNAIAEGTDGTDTEEALAALTADQVKAIVAAPASKPAAKPAPLYASRPVTNAATIMAWAKSQGFTSTLPAADLHVTVAYSRDSVDGAKVPPGASGVSVLGGKRTVEPLGDEGAVVLKFTSAEMQNRWKAYRDAGASWDYEGYTPHVTITYDGKDVDLSKVQPYQGPIELGPEKQEPLNVNKSDDYKGNEEPAAPTLADKIKAKRAEAAPQPAPEPVAEEAAPQPEPAPEAKPVRNDALIDLRKQLSVLKALRACLG